MSDDVAYARGRPLMAGPGTDAAREFALPTGTVTFLLTDVEGSSRRWETVAEVMPAAIARHYDLLGEAIAAHGGVRPVEQGEGDSVVGAFSRATDAMHAAVDAQRALGAEPWPEGAEIRVRMAIHTGEAQMRDSGNYFGQAIIRCARLRAIGHGGQVLVSDASAALVASHVPDQEVLTDMGVHRLKDLSRPERVWQLTAPGLAEDFAPLRSLDAFAHNLPVQLTPLIGREELTVEVAERLGEDRLVTLTGAGGVGKTRLALAVAGEALDRFRGGVWLVELAGLANPDGVGAAILASLGVHEGPGGNLSGQVAAYFGDQRALVVLDNCEHVIGGCAQFVAELLAASSGISVLATSREPLSVPGEVTWRVPSLAAPPSEAALAVNALSQFDAVRLFVDRARRARPSFAVTDINASAVAQICSRLDGIPLAIELAAARCRQLSAERIAHDLDDRFRLLTGGARTVLPRHQTLAASIDWSHDRLDPDEAVTFRRLGVLVGPFPLEAAEGIVAGPGDVDPVGVFDTLSRLVDKNLVWVEDTPDGEPHYRLLETLRAYAAHRAQIAGELAGLRRHHATWWLAWLEARWEVGYTDAVIEEIDRFYDNLRAALDWSVGDAGIGLALLRHLGRHAQTTGRASDLLEPIDLLLIEDNTREHAAEWIMAAHYAGPMVGFARGQSPRIALHDAAVRLAVSVGDEYGAVYGQWLNSFSEDLSVALGDLARQRRDRYVESLAVIGLAQARAILDPAAALALLASDEFADASRLSSYLNNFADRARAFAALGLGDLGECVELARKLMASNSVVMVSCGLEFVRVAGLLTADETLLDQACGLARQRGLDSDVPLLLHRLDLVRGDAAPENPFLRPQADELCPYEPNELQHFAREAMGVIGPELTLAATRERTPSGRHGQTVLALIEAKGDQDERKWHVALLLAAEHQLRLIAVDALEGLAVAAARSESWAESLRLYGAAQRLRDECSYRWRYPYEQREIDQAVESARSQIAPEEAKQAENQGREMPWADAVLYARRARGERKRPRHGWASLTPTEHQVVDLVAEGLTNQQIAERLIMGRATVKTHLEHIFAKLGVTTRTELALQAAQRNT
jgi:predicted ATPase/class 3 adenylate cyclase/DNA-binding CsgD family transcriptional regulator